MTASGTAPADFPHPFDYEAAAWLLLAENARRFGRRDALEEAWKRDA
jgi:hypothetical protein